MGESQKFSKVTLKIVTKSKEKQEIFSSWWVGTLFDTSRVCEILSWDANYENQKIAGLFGYFVPCKIFIGIQVFHCVCSLCAKSYSLTVGTERKQNRYSNCEFIYESLCIYRGYQRVKVLVLDLKSMRLVIERSCTDLGFYFVCWKIIWGRGYNEIEMSENSSCFLKERECKNSW